MVLLNQLAPSSVFGLIVLLLGLAVFGAYVGLSVNL